MPEFRRLLWSCAISLWKSSLSFIWEAEARPSKVLRHKRGRNISCIQTLIQLLRSEPLQSFGGVSSFLPKLNITVVLRVLSKDWQHQHHLTYRIRNIEDEPKNLCFNDPALPCPGDSDISLSLRTTRLQNQSVVCGSAESNITWKHVRNRHSGNSLLV